MHAPALGNIDCCTDNRKLLQRVGARSEFDHIAQIRLRFNSNHFASWANMLCYCNADGTNVSADVEYCSANGNMTTNHLTFKKTPFAIHGQTSGEVQIKKVKVLEAVPRGNTCQKLRERNVGKFVEMFWPVEVVAGKQSAVVALFLRQPAADLENPALEQFFG